MARKPETLKRTLASDDSSAIYQTASAEFKSSTLSDRRCIMFPISFSKFPGRRFSRIQSVHVRTNLKGRSMRKLRANQWSVVVHGKPSTRCPPLVESCRIRRPFGPHTARNWLWSRVVWGRVAPHCPPPHISSRAVRPKGREVHRSRTCLLSTLGTKDRED